MAFNDHNSGFFQTIPVTIQNKQAIDSIIMLRGYTSRLVNTTPTTVMILANHPISLLLFLKNCKIIFPTGKQSKHHLRLCLFLQHCSRPYG
jgi:hypothetical protein